MCSKFIKPDVKPDFLTIHLPQNSAELLVSFVWKESVVKPKPGVLMGEAIAHITIHCVTWQKPAYASPPSPVPDIYTLMAYAK